MKILRTTDRNFRYDFGKIYNGRMDISESIEKAVSDILDDVKRIGDQALFKYTEKFDGFKPTAKSVLVSSKEIATAQKKVTKDELASLKLAAKRIEDFSKLEVAKSWEKKKDGVTMGIRYNPLERAGIYVPGGKAAYPSTVLMTAIPARVAGVQEIVMCAPCPNGELNPAVLVAAQLAGVSKIFKVGGAQAIGAMAFGTKTIPQVDKIVGPGNIYVTVAKKFVYGQVDIDMIAGPSEICILADGSAPPAFMAADMLAQAEHDEMACPLMITDNSNYASRVEGEIRIQLTRLPRKDIAGVSIKNRALIVLVRNMNEGIDLVNELAPEHLELAVKKAAAVSKKIVNAGAIFIGDLTPETMGDYLAGPSHVLPTQGTARYFSVLRPNDFLKATSVLSMDSKAFEKFAPHAIRLAEMEGLTAHARAVEVRMKKE